MDINPQHQTRHRLTPSLSDARLWRIQFVGPRTANIPTPTSFLTIGDPTESAVSIELRGGGWGHSARGRRTRPGFSNRAIKYGSARAGSNWAVAREGGHEFVADGTLNCGTWVDERSRDLSLLFGYNGRARRGLSKRPPPHPTPTPTHTSSPELSASRSDSDGSRAVNCTPGNRFQHVSSSARMRCTSDPCLEFPKLLTIQAEATDLNKPALQ